MYFYTGEINDELKTKSSYLKESEILLIENIRFFKEETENDENFQKNLENLVKYILMMLSLALTVSNHLFIVLQNL